MNYEEIIIPSTTGALGAFVTWIFGRKKENAEIQGSEIQNVTQAIAIWKDMATELKIEVAELKQKVDELSNEVHNLRAENLSLRNQLNLPNESDTHITKRHRTS